jgi:hypothetical protein
MARGRAAMKALRNRFAWLALLLVVIVAADVARTLPTQVGIDFYHLWGVPMGQRASAVPLSPYAQTAEYAALLNTLAETSTSEAFRVANRFKREIAPTGTPLFYAAFGFLPDEYGAAHVLFAVLQYLAGAAAIFILARLRGLGPWPALCAALAVELTFNPFVQDVKWGNATAFQLLFIACALATCKLRLYEKSRAVDAGFLAALAVFVLFKPNTIWIAAALALHFAAVRGARRALVATAVAVPAAVIAWGLGAWYFKDAAIWNEWLGYLRGGALVYRFEEGNQSWPMLLAQLAPMHDAYRYSLLVSAFFLTAFLVLMMREGGAALLVPRARAVLSDPWAATGLGVIFTLAASPLVWPYYHLFALLPIAWLLRGEGRWNAASTCAAISYAALSSPVLALLVAAEQYAILRVLMFLSWIPLIPAALWRIAPVARGEPRSS